MFPRPIDAKAIFLAHSHTIIHRIGYVTIVSTRS
jgi:hypothetical protein